MQLSKDLPTAVDFTNILVNYIEVSADDIPKPKPEQHVPPGVYPPQVLQDAGTEVKDHEPASMGQTQLVEGEPKAEPVFWGKEVPKYLRDVDLPEHSKRYARAARGVTEFPTPPGLPLFLGKSILNGTTPMKDDSSVLNMPNHTVLNHLATSSIKNEVLATSITTRYKRKVSSPRLFNAMELATCLPPPVRHHDRIQAHGFNKLKIPLLNATHPQRCMRMPAESDDFHQGAKLLSPPITPQRIIKYYQQSFGIS